ncbi:MAG: hypothetical protein IJE74_03035 [Clostridia bacterium]|nr:hypothetical protein [Clostridia bacterium]
MKEETKIIIKDTAIRAAKTFLQAFLSAISVDALLGVTDFDAFKKVGLSMLIAALAAGISAVWNGTVKALNGGECQ